MGGGTTRQTAGAWFRELLWGRSSSGDATVPIHYPLLAVLAIAASIAPTTWFIPSFYGYLLSGAVLCLIILYGLLFVDLRVVTDAAFLVLFGGYWVGLVARYVLYSSNPSLLQYIVVTPIAVFATVIVLPQLIDGRRETFAMGLTLLSVVVMLIGALMVWWAYTADVVLYDWVATDVMGLYPIRTPSVFANPNTYGLFIMIGSFAALYTALARGGLVWIVALGLCLFGLFMSEGDAAILGFGVGSIVILSARHRLLSFLGLGVGIAALYAMIRVGHLPEVMETTLMSRVDRWVLSLERLARDPLWGIGFVDPGPEIGSYRGPHNSYLGALLHTGVIAGTLYIGSLIYGICCGIRRRWTPWTGFSVGTTVGLLTFMWFESFTLGGLSTSSVVLGIVIGLMLLSDPDTDPRTRQPVTRPAFSMSPVGRALKRLRTVGRTTIDSSAEPDRR